MIRSSSPEQGEAGFTLVEALIAILILVFGLMAIANLFVVANSSNSVANQGTAATVAASDVIERLRARPFTSIAVGGDITSAVCDDTAFSECTMVPGVGQIRTRWAVTAPSAQVRYITVRSEGTGMLSGARSRSQFTMFRACTASVAAGCPAGP